MRSIERRFIVFTDQEPLLSTIIIFSRSVKGQNFSERMIRVWFPKLVDKDDYEASDRKEIIAYMVSLSNS